VCEIDERPIAADDLVNVREAFLASTVREVLPVHAIDGRPVPEAGGPLATDAAARVRAHIEQELGVAAG
jgi:branched-chain amino acid aminotransferase